MLEHYRETYTERDRQRERAERERATENHYRCIGGC